jgi:sarcosine oxidase delta subunit
MAFTLTCPICGKRNGYEFRYGGEEKGPRPDEESLTPETWCDYVHMNTCVAGIQPVFKRSGGAIGMVAASGLPPTGTPLAISR